MTVMTIVMRDSKIPVTWVNSMAVHVAYCLAEKMAVLSGGYVVAQRATKKAGLMHVNWVHKMVD